MAIKLKIHEDRVKLRIAVASPIKLIVGGKSASLTPYTGDYEVTPSEEEQVLLTDGLAMTDNVTINPIPSNYGRIAYNGVTLTVY